MQLAAPDPAQSDRIAATLEWLAKVAGSALILWGFVEKVAKPFSEWRRRQREVEREKLAELIRKVIHDELTSIKIFDDLDALLVIAHDNRERLDEMNDLMNAFGLESDRRGAERTAKATELFDRLTERQKQRRRRADAQHTHDHGYRAMGVTDDDARE